MGSVPSEIEQLIARLAPETWRRRQSAVLRPLNTWLIVITAIGLLANLLTTRNITGLLLTAGSLLVNLTVALLDRWGRTGLAAHLFCVWVNLGILVLFGFNLLLDGDLAMGVLFASQLALSVMLAGLLIGIPYGVIYVVVDVFALGAILYRYTATAGRIGPVGPLTDLLMFGIPLASFLVLIVVITWLYQRALTKAETRIEEARKRIIQDELIRRDLAIARELQLRLFPPPPLLSRDVRIASRSQAARETSGDFYDFIELGEGLLGIVVADVTGKSVAAALMMALARVTIRSEARRHTSPAEVLRAANETISRDHTARQLITAFYGVLDTRRLVLRFANAGHPYPILRRGGRLVEIEVAGMPLGGRPETSYVEQVLELEAGDQLYLISDGLVEERNGRREMFGYGRLNPAILAADMRDPEQALDDLWQAVARFRGGAEQADDITLLVIQPAPVATEMQTVPIISAHAAGA